MSSQDNDSLTFWEKMLLFFSCCVSGCFPSVCYAFLSEKCGTLSSFTGKLSALNCLRWSGDFILLKFFSQTVQMKMQNTTSGLNKYDYSRWLIFVENISFVKSRCCGDKNNLVLQNKCFFCTIELFQVIRSSFLSVAVKCSFFCWMMFI